MGNAWQGFHLYSSDSCEEVSEEIMAAQQELLDFERYSEIQSVKSLPRIFNFRYTSHHGQRIGRPPAFNAFA